LADGNLSHRGGHVKRERNASPSTLAAVPDSPRDAAELDFEQVVQESLDTLPAELRRAMSNVTIVVEDEPPAGAPLLGLYQGVPLTRRTSGYSGALPDKITIFRGPLERHYGTSADRLREQIRHVVVHEVAHHFGISDERLIELDRY
jgi:predicted Zn-dependent protease with MMP-like domain